MSFIDLKMVLGRTVSAAYGDLVTRRTGQAVRTGVEEDLAVLGLDKVAVIDFTSVRCLDFSCADEIIGKLLLRHGGARYFLLRGVTDSHSEAIETILERYGLAVVAETRAGQKQILGAVSDAVRKAFDVVVETGAAGVADVAYQLSIPDANARETIDELLHRRLAIAATADDRVMSIV